MPIIIPIKDLRDTTKISEKCHQAKEPIFITKNGYGDMVIMSMDTYEELILQNEIDTAIGEYKADMAKGVTMLDAKEVLSELGRE